MNHLLSLFVLCAVPSVALAQAAPQVFVEPAKWSDGSISIDISVRAPTSGERVAVGGPARPWHTALSLKVTNADGLEQRWPLDSPGPEGASQTVVLSSTIGVGRAYKLTRKQLAKLKSGTYELTATLDLRGAGAGFDGLVEATNTVDIGAPVAPKYAPAKDLPALVAALASKKSPLQRSAGVMGLEGALLDAPELPPGPSLDALVAAHLTQLAARMTAGPGYGSGPDFTGPTKDLLYAQKVLLTPGRVSPTFKTTLASTGVVVVPAVDLETFWKWVHVEQKKGLHLFAVRATAGLARVATSYVRPGGPPEQRVEISFWQHGEKGWSLVSFEPWPTQARDLHANVHRPGKPPRSPADLTDVERAQWLELRLGLVDICAGDFAERGRGGATLERGFGGETIDRTYLPLLKARLEVGSDAARGAVAAALLSLGVEFPLSKLVELLLVTTADTQRELLLRALRPQLSGGRPAGPSELREILGVSTGLNTSGTLIGDALATVTTGDVDGGSTTLYRKAVNGWQRVSVIESWVH